MVIDIDYFRLTLRGTPIIIFGEEGYQLFWDLQNITNISSIVSGSCYFIYGSSINILINSIRAILNTVEFDFIDYRDNRNNNNRYFEINSSGGVPISITNDNDNLESNAEISINTLR